MSVYTVGSNAELVNVLKTIEGLGGGTIKLDPAGGPYQIEARGLGSEASPVTITSLNPSSPAVVDAINLRDASHVTISDLHIEGKEAGNQHSVMVNESDNVTLTNNTMTGQADGFLSESGSATHGNAAMFVRNSSDIVVTNNTISHFGGGIGVLEIDGLTIEGNDISHLQGDGVRGGGIQNASISDNHFHDFYGSTQSLNHSDMIQLWGTNAESVTSNVTISGNVLDTGNGAISQGIFIRNEEFGRGNDPVNGLFQNITITDNIVHNGAPHGIAVADVNGLVIQSNTLLLNEAAYLFDADGRVIPPTEPRYQISNSQNITATGNLGSEFLGQIAEANNTVLVYNNPADPMYVSNHIMNLSGAGDTDLRDLQIRSDSPLWGQTGSTLSSLPDNSLDIVFASSSVAGNALEVEFDAGYGNIAEGSTVEWHFQDGTVLTGENVAHVFADPGRHQVQLVIEDAGGERTTLVRSIEVDDPYLFSFDFSGDAEDGSKFGVTPDVTGANQQAFVQTPEGGGFHLTSGTGFNISHTNQQLNGLSAFEINLRFRQDDAGGEGGLLGIHTVFKLDIMPDGALSFWMHTDDGNFRITTDAGVMNDLDWHDISVRYDSTEGAMSLIVDGETLATGPATGSTDGSLTSGFQLGRPWGENAEGVFESLSMNLPYDATSVSPTVVLVEEPEAPAEPVVVVEEPTVVVSDEPDNAPAPAPAPANDAPGAENQPVTASEQHALLDIDFADQGNDTSGYNAATKDPTEGAGFVDGLEGSGFHLCGKGGFQIETSNTHLYGLDAFNIGFDFRKDAEDSHGGLLNQHTILDLELHANGSLTLRLNTDEGKVKLTTDAGALPGTDWHHIDLAYDGAQGEVAILVDGTSVATAPLTGTTADAQYWNMIIGDPWHPAAEGVVDNLMITRPVLETDMDSNADGEIASVQSMLFEQSDTSDLHETHYGHSAENRPNPFENLRNDDIDETFRDTSTSDTLFPF